MIELYCTSTTANGFAALFGFPVAIKKLKMWGAARLKFYDYATVAAAQAAIAGGSPDVVAELRGNSTNPIDSLECGTNEIINCSRGLVVFADGSSDPASTSIRIYTMNNPVGSQGS